jgi:hypothetical protein
LTLNRKKERKNPQAGGNYCKQGCGSGSALFLKAGFGTRITVELKSGSGSQDQKALKYQNEDVEARGRSQ